MADLRSSKLKIKSSIKNYEVCFGTSFLDSLLSELQDNDFIFIDKNVFNNLSQEIKEIITFKKNIVIDATESQKSYDVLEPIIIKLINKNFRRSDRLVSIGGGITQDITAFIASMMYRGVDWIFFPTTLLAQADSCIGGKTSINIKEYKNQLGNFYPPIKIFIIPEVLKSLSLIDFKSGMGEMLHFYLVSGEKDFDYYRDRYDKAFEDENILLEIVRRNLEIKKGFIERDEFDTGERLLLNYGHSFGHAIESLTNYEIPHGIAVSYGMDMANFISVKMGFLEQKIRIDIRNQLKKIWSDVKLGNLNITDFEEALSRDKKNIGNTYQLILTKGIGKMFKHGIEPNQNFTKWLNEYFSQLELK
mgnify:FL=1